MKWTAIAQDYLNQRRLLGYALVSEGRCIQDFSVFADQQQAQPVTIALALDWASRAPSGSGIAISRRFSMLRPFFRYASGIKQSVPVLPKKYVGITHRRLAPFIFSDSLILQLMEASNTLASRQGLRPATMQALIGLLASTGLRPGEAVRLARAAINHTAGEINIYDSKNWRHRIVPLSPSTLCALEHYQSIRDRIQPIPTSGAFFLRDDGQPLDIAAADYAFGLLRKQLDLTSTLSGHLPRLYDLRHSFVCKRIISWYHAGVNVDALMPQLSRYLGHKKVTATYWYISAIPELMECAAHKFTLFSNKGGSYECAY